MKHTKDSECSYHCEEVANRESQQCALKKAALNSELLGVKCRRQGPIKDDICNEQPYRLDQEQYSIA